MEATEFCFGNLENHLKNFKQYLITDAHSWQTAVAEERESTGNYDIFFALILRGLRFDRSPEDFSGFLEVTDQGILDEMHNLDDTYGKDNPTRYEDFAEVPMGVVHDGTTMDGTGFLCIECVKEILGRDLTPGDFVSNPMTMRSGGIITQLFHNEEELAAEEASELSKLKEELPQEKADEKIQEARSRYSADQLDAFWKPCNKCEHRVWGDLGLSTDSTVGYSLEKKIWNHVWERWVQIRDKEE